MYVTQGDTGVIIGQNLAEVFAFFGSAVGAVLAKADPMAVTNGFY